MAAGAQSELHMSVPELLAQALERIVESETGKVLVIGGRKTNFTGYDVLEHTGRVNFWLGEEGNSKTKLPSNTTVVILTRWRAPQMRDRARVWCSEAHALLVDVDNSTGLLNTLFFSPLIATWGLSSDSSEALVDEDPADTPPSESESTQDFAEIASEVSAAHAMMAEALERMRLDTKGAVAKLEERIKIKLRPEIEAEMRAKLAREIEVKIQAGVEEVRRQLHLQAESQMTGIQARMRELDNLNGQLKAANDTKDEELEQLRVEAARQTAELGELRAFKAALRGLLKP